MGVKKGYAGLINGEIYELTLRSVSDIIKQGGTFLQTARAPEIKTQEGIDRAIKMAHIYEIDVLVVIGGDGSFRGGLDISRAGMPVIGIPGTIDNDISSTEYSIGYDTAMNTALDALDKIKDTASSHERCSVLEVMGRRAGHIALNVAIAGGAEVALIPEKEYDLNKDVIKPIIEARNRGKSHFVVVAAEGAVSVAEETSGTAAAACVVGGSGGAINIANEIQSRTGIESRATVLGHIQRGGAPTLYDRVAASKMGARAVDLLVKGSAGRIIGMKSGDIVDMDIEEALAMSKGIDEEKYSLVRILSM